MIDNSGEKYFYSTLILFIIMSPENEEIFRQNFSPVLCAEET
jgi:hypothetical protein